MLPALALICTGLWRKPSAVLHWVPSQPFRLPSVLRAASAHAVLPEIKPKKSFTPLSQSFVVSQFLQQDLFFLFPGGSRGNFDSLRLSCQWPFGLSPLHQLHPCTSKSSSSAADPAPRSVLSSPAGSGQWPLHRAEMLLKVVPCTPASWARRRRVPSPGSRFPSVPKHWL